jgi:hypothetical protein
VAGEDDEELEQTPPPIPPDAKEVTRSPRTDALEGLGASGTPADSSAALARLIRIRPFMSLFCWLADLQYPAHLPRETRILNHRRDSACFYRLCLALDFLVTFLAVAGIIAIALCIAYKSLMPLPAFWK